ncbi:hypothetical protein I317_01109 [Kwoniella heveanensis CBS 569]|nr:hypothetical protein I317_01109 [Kwoniella heveanensis CBS 569]
MSSSLPNPKAKDAITHKPDRLDIPKEKTTATDTSQLPSILSLSDSGPDPDSSSALDLENPSSSDKDKVVLRNYQVKAIQACDDALKRGVRRFGVSAPTGSGKTTMFMHLIPLVSDDFAISSSMSSPSISSPSSGSSSSSPAIDPQSFSPDDRSNNDVTSKRGQIDKEKEAQRPMKRQRRQTLILVGSVELANQAQRAAERLLGEGWTVEVEQSKRHASGKADVTIATYQTLINPDRLAKFVPDRFKLIIVDEAHHAAAHSYLRLLHYFNNSVLLSSSLEPFPSTAESPQVPIVGFTATFSRADQLALSSVFEEIVYHIDIRDLLEDGHLCDIKSTLVKAALNLDQVKMGNNGDYRTSSLAEKLDTDEVNELIVGTYLHKAANRRSTLIFCVDLAHVSNLTNAFRSAGIDARSISSASKADLRKETIAAFGRGEFPVLINCEILTEGTDIPEIDCIILARPTKSRNLLVQMVGRGLRLSPKTGKENCHLIDIVDSVGRANGMLVSPTLWGLTHEDMDEREREHQASQGSTSNPASDASDSALEDYEITYVDLDDPFNVATDMRPVVERTTRNAWVACGKGRYILEAMGNGYLSIDPSPAESLAKFTITYRHAIPPELIQSRGRKTSPYGKPRVVGHADDLERAIQTGDKYAERTLGRDLFLQLSRYASWRRKPASEKALKLLLKLKGEENPGTLFDDRGRGRTVEISGQEVAVSGLTSGQVSSWLVGAKHGAKTFRSAQDRATQRAQAKAEAKAEKERLLKARNLPLPQSGSR